MDDGKEVKRVVEINSRPTERYGSLGMAGKNSQTKHIN